MTAVRIHVLSDLHLEFGPFTSEPVEADVIVLAGDTDLGTRGLEWAAKTFPKLPVIYVACNHEFYGHSSPKIDKAMRETARGSASGHRRNVEARGQSARGFCAGLVGGVWET